MHIGAFSHFITTSYYLSKKKEKKFRKLGGGIVKFELHRAKDSFRDWLKRRN
jgi:hypothetical protein